ncbi:MAG TPA: transporter [Ignavibacteriaceae bacterium]|nr:transporter [Ignavibacteriaceae bacterium]
MNVKRNLVSLLILISFLVLCDEIIAGGWTKKKGKFYLQINSQYMRSNKFHDIDGTLVNINTLSDFTLSLYAEYGITDDLTIISSIPFYHRLTLNEVKGNNSGTVYFPGAKKTGVSDSRLGVRYKLTEGNGSVLSAGFTLGLPFGDSNDPNGLLTGDGEFNQELSLQFGHSFYPLPIYTSAYAGYNLRHKGYTDEIRFGVEAGYTFDNKLLLIFRVTGLKPLRNGDNTVAGGAGGLFSNNQQYIAYGPELFYNVTENWGVTAGANAGTWARNVLSAYVYRFGIFIRN